MVPTFSKTSQKPSKSPHSYRLMPGFTYKIYRGILFQKVALGYLLHFAQNGSSKSILKQICLHNNLKHQKNTRSDFYLGAQTKRKVITKSIVYARCRKILFHKVALGYLLHFAQNGSSKKQIRTHMFAQQSQKTENVMTRLPSGSTSSM